MTHNTPEGLPPLPDDEKLEGRLYQDVREFVSPQVKGVIRELMQAYAREALRAMPASRKDIEQAAFEKWLDKERPSGDVEQVQRQWEESSDYEEVQPAALMAEISHWHAIAQGHEVELRELRAQAASPAPPAHVPADVETPIWNSIQIASWIGSQLMHEPAMFERSAVCKFVRSLGRHPTLIKHSPQHPTPEPAQAVDADPLEDFQEGQWWIKELDSMVAEATPDQRRAVAVVHNLLRAASNTCQPQVQQGGSDTREALRLGVECLRNWKILHPEDFDELDERAVALLKAALTAKEPK